MDKEETNYKMFTGKVPACGVFCSGCPVHLREKKPCPGADKNPARCEKCKSFHLCCRSKGFNHCFQCPTFPCNRFKRFAKTWLKYGQDLIANQLYLKNHGTIPVKG